MFGHDYAVPGTYEVTMVVADNSGDVLVTPGISKPERSRFEACAYGTLLILAPWPEDMPTFTSDYEKFHYLNRLAETICAIGHTTKVTVQGLRLSNGG